jgi:hypothetical protein
MILEHYGRRCLVSNEEEEKYRNNSLHASCVLKKQFHNGTSYKWFA